MTVFLPPETVGEMYERLRGKGWKFWEDLTDLERQQFELVYTWGRNSTPLLSSEDWAMIRWCVFTVEKGFVGVDEAQRHACELRKKLDQQIGRVGG